MAAAPLGLSLAEKGPMVSTLCLLSCALAMGQTPGRTDLQPQLARGQELVYSGTFTEEWFSKRVQTQRSYRIDATFLVLDANQDQYQLACLTVITTQDRKITEPKGETTPPSSVRLEIITIDRQGKLLGNTKNLVAPLEGPPTIELGAFVETPKTRPNGWWETNEGSRPPRIWKIDGTEVVSNVKCQRLVGVQQSEDWTTPRADSAAWQRRDTIWISPQAGMACRFERVIEEHAPASDAVAHLSRLRCELGTGLTYSGNLFDQRAAEISQARKFASQIEPWLREPEQKKPQLENTLKKIKQYLDFEPSTPYRKAIAQVQKRIEAALRGEIIPSQQEETPAAPRVGVGHKVPDFVCSDLVTRQTYRLQRSFGKPVLLVFLNPETELGRSTLELSKALSQRYPDKISVLPLAVTEDIELVRKLHQEMKLPCPILNGNGMHQMFGVDGLPHFVVIDSDGVIRSISTGWGAHTPAEQDDLLQRCLKK
jgi:hypothetical protein